MNSCKMSVNNIGTLLRPLYICQQSLRFAGGRENCMERHGPPCSEEELEKGECRQNKKKTGEEKKKESPFKSMWENPDCCVEICKDKVPRFDELYYKESDKRSRKYARTWAECPELRIVQKPLCCFEKVDLPPIEKRKRKARGAGKQDRDCSDAPPCKQPVNKGPCPKLVLPGCRAVREPPKCFVIKTPSDCKKVCTPYPAFSECKRDPQKKKHPIECDCLKANSLCTLWDMVRAGLIKMKNNK